jgi:hypothetical protein
MLLVVAVAGLRTRQENRVYSGENTDYVMRIRVRRFQYYVRRLLFRYDVTSGRMCCTSVGIVTDSQLHFRVIRV